MAEARWVRWMIEHFRDSERIRRMRLDEVGLYTLMLVEFAYLNGAPLPGDDRALARMLRRPYQSVRRALPIVRLCWEDAPGNAPGIGPGIGPGILVNRRMLEELERASSAYKKAVSAGRKGSKSRWGGHPPSHDRKKEEREEKNGPDVKTRSGSYSGTETSTSTRGGRRGASEEQSLPGMEPPPKRKRAQPTGPQAELIAWFVKTWGDVHPGASYIVTAKDGVSASWLLKAASVEEIHRRIGEMFRAKWPGPTLTLSKARGAWNEFAPGYKRPSANGHATPTAEQIEGLRSGLLDRMQRRQALEWAQKYLGLDEQAAYAAAGLTPK